LLAAAVRLCDLTREELEVLNVALDALLGEKQGRSKVVCLVFLASVVAATDNPEHRVRSDQARLVIEQEVRELLHQGRESASAGFAAVDEDEWLTRPGVKSCEAIEADAARTPERDLVGDEVAQVEDDDADVRYQQARVKDRELVEAKGAADLPGCVFDPPLVAVVAALVARRGHLGRLLIWS
jgi:hypothetical protein